MLILFLLCAFRSGTDRFYLRRAQGFDSKGRDIFFYFRPKKALSLVGFYINLYLRKLTVFIVCFAPFLSVSLFAAFAAERFGLSVEAFRVLLSTAVVLFVDGIIFFIRLNGFFFLARYFFVSDKYFSFRQLFAFSYKLIKDKKMTVLKKRLSFAGWFVGCLFLLPVSFVRSHYNRSMAELANDLMTL